METKTLQGQQKYNLEDGKDYLYGRAFNGKNLFKVNLRVDGFLHKWCQQEASMERKKIVLTIFPLAKDWWLIEDEKQEEEQETLDG